MSVDAERMDGLVSLLAPLSVGIALALLLLMQMRRTSAAQRAMVVSEERYRLAVDAARCGIWEWDLENDRVFMSEVTGGDLRLGRRRRGRRPGGARPGGPRASRAGPPGPDPCGHLRRLRCLLPGAGRGRPPLDLDRLPAARGADGAQAESHNRIIGVALDVTEERIAQARAQAAENRLRDAIESVSEAFVLWDRHGRLLLCNRNYRATFNLEAKILKPGAARDQVNRFAQLAIKQEHPSPHGRKGEREAELMDGRWVQISERRTAEGAWS